MTTPTPLDTPPAPPADDADLTDTDLDALAAAGQSGSNQPPPTAPSRTRPAGLFWDLLKP